MKNVLSLIMMAVLTVSLTVTSDAGEKRYKIGVYFWHESSHDDIAFEGVRAGFEKAGIACEFDIQRAYSDRSKAAKIVQKFADEKPNLIYSLGTDATLQLMKKIEDTPIIFTAVNNPVLSGIVPAWKSSGRNIAGNSNWIPTNKILETFKEVVPGLKTLGVMYDPDNPVSSTEVKSAKNLIDALGIKLIPIKVRKADDLIPAARHLVSKNVESIWIPIDLLVYSNIEKLKSITVPAKIPMVASSQRGVKEGAILGMVVSYKHLGLLSVPMAIKILTKGVAPHTLPIRTMRNYRTLINLSAAKEIGYEIPREVLAVADEIIK